MNDNMQLYFTMLIFLPVIVLIFSVGVSFFLELFMGDYDE